MFIVLGSAFLVLICAGGAVVAYLLDWEIDGWVFCGCIAALVSVVVVIFVFINPIGVQAEIIAFNETARTLEAARLNPNISPLELAAIQQKVIEMNQWLAGSQYWAKHPLTNWFWPKEIFKLKPIR